MIQFQFNDGGRAEAGFKGQAGDCVTRALAIVTGEPYLAIYNDLSARMKKAGLPRSARNGIPKGIYQPVMAELGLTWVSTMWAGSGITVHVKEDELPSGRIILRLSGHLSACIDRVIHDTHDPSREGTRGVYGFWR